MVHDMSDQIEHRARGTREIGELRLVAARRHYILNQIVAADRIEVGVEILDRERRRRHLDHHAERRHRSLAALAAQLIDRILKQRTATIELLRHGDHGDHHLQISGHRRARQRPQLQAEHVQPPERQPHPAHAEKRIEISRLRQSRNRLVAAGIERANGHRPAGGPFGHLPVDLVLLFLARQLFALLKQKLGPHQADAVDLSTDRYP